MSQTGLYPSCPILLVDDEPNALTSFDLALRAAGLTNTVKCGDGREALRRLREQEIEVMLSDLVMPGLNGEQLLAAVTEAFPEVPVIMVTGVNDVDTVVDCMRRGAFDYVLKPVESDRLIPSVRRAIEVRDLRRQNTALRRHFLGDKLERPDAFAGIVTRSRRMRSLFQYCEAVAESPYPVLITGETGTGKELFARALHDLSGRQGEFVAVNVAGLDDGHLSDALFGHTRGAFTGADRARPGLVERAAGGTLFLDEIGDLPSASQVKLLRLLEEREYFPLGSDVKKPSRARALVATHADLDAQEQVGRFRRDLYYRLRTHHVHVPPLRERREDIPLLLDHFLATAASELGKRAPTYHDELLALLRSYAFPGNVRELRSMVFDAVSKHSSRMLSSDVFREQIAPSAQQAPSDVGPSDAVDSLRDLVTLPTLKESATLLIREAMRRASGNRRVAAMMLGITPQALGQRLKRLSISP